MFREPEREPAANAILQRSPEEVGCDRLDARTQRVRPCDEASHRRSAPQRAGIGGEAERVRLFRLETGDPSGHLAAQRPFGQRLDDTLGVARGAGGIRNRAVGDEPESFKCADGVSFDEDLARGGDGREQVLPRTHADNEGRCPPIDKALDQTMV